MIQTFIDETYRMYVDNRAGGVAIFTFQDADGLARDVSARTISFKVGSSFRKVLTNTSNSSQKQLVIAENELAAFTNRTNLTYAVIDETSDPDLLILKGKLIVTGQ